MALIPLKDLVEIKNVKLDANNEPLIDAWGNPTYDSPVVYKSRIDEKSKLVRNQQGYEVISNTQILIDGVVEVSYESEITYVDATGKTVSKKPLAISRIKDLSKVIFTRIDL